ncbi:MAG TPA: alginate lyase family protein [Anaerolineales bacterium]|nr:alginate lyase family protein [Anaerolineales bacterium]
MLNNFRNLNALYQSLGARWLLFRLGYALRMRTGILRQQIPSYRWEDRPLKSWLKKGIPSGSEAYARWRREHSPHFFFVSLGAPAQSPGLGERSDERSSHHAVEGRSPVDVPWNPQLAVAEAERILNGELQYFAHEFFRTGFPPDWHRDPASGKRVNASKHWSEISSDADVDIKFIWEASRFSMVYTLVRAYASTPDSKFAEAFWELIESWAQANPPNTGPNWMDGQEAALRLMAWTFGFYAFLDSPATTPARMAQFTMLVAAHAERIHKNIAFAISTRGNHTISEAFGLWLVGLLFPELKDARKYFGRGRRLLEREALAQIFPDGSYSMYSLNYHRFILHIYLYAIRLGQLNGSPFSDALRQRVAASLDYLSQLIDPHTGRMPVYGSNDGALVLPLNKCDFTDYRPLLQLGSFLLKGKPLFEPGSWDEDMLWLCGTELTSRKNTELSDLRALRSSFPDGGTYLLRGATSRAIIRCTDFRSRPSHADQLHVDLWWRDDNIACDAGTYLYSGEGMWRNGLARTAVHNTVTVDHQDQMHMVSRFTWTHWARGKVLRHDAKVWQGEHDGYKRLADPVSHKRTVLSLDADRWLVVDHLRGKQTHQYALHWLLCDSEYGVRELGPASYGIWLDRLNSKLSDSRFFLQTGLLEGDANFSVVRGDANSTRGWRSQYYGHKEPAISILLEANRPEVVFWSFFGLDGDAVDVGANALKIRIGAGETSINLQSLIFTP